MQGHCSFSAHAQGPPHVPPTMCPPPCAHSSSHQLPSRYNQLRQDGIVPDTSTFNCLLKGCMRARDVKRAGLALEWMAAAGVAADEITWNTLIKVAGGWEAAGRGRLLPTVLGVGEGSCCCLRHPLVPCSSSPGTARHFCANPHPPTCRCSPTQATLRAC